LEIEPRPIDYRESRIQNIQRHHKVSYTLIKQIFFVTIKRKILHRAKHKFISKIMAAALASKENNI
jgi:hypothetical protein